MGYPTGKGVFIWQLINCCGGNMDYLAQKARELGISWAAIKAADGVADFNSDLMAAAIPKLELAGVEVWGWQYIYGANKWFGKPVIATVEAATAIRNINKWRFAGWILDPESEYKRSGAAAWADAYMTALRTTFPKLSIGLCSYRFPSLHPELPWQSFLRRCDFHMPQVYWAGAHNPGNQLRQSYRELQALRALPFIPTGAAYVEKGKWAGPTVAEINEFDQEARELKLPGVNWWAWDDGLESHPAWWAAIAAHHWGVVPTPVPALTVEERLKRLEKAVFG
jgi:hypothetical protein